MFINTPVCGIIKKNNNTPSENEWQPKSDWWDIDSILENDTEEYPCKIITLLQDIEDITNIDRINAAKIKTSDGTEYGTASELYNHTWDKTKDKECSLGYKTRYIIYYFNNTDGPNYNKLAPVSSIYIIAKNINTNNNFNAFSGLRICECIKLLNCTFGGRHLFFNNCDNLVKIVGFNSTSANLEGSGQGVFINNYNLKNIDMNCSKTIPYFLRSTFNRCYSLKNSEYFNFDDFNIDTKLVRAYWSCFPQSIKVLKEINFDNLALETPNNWIYAFQDCRSLVKIEKIGTIDKTNFNFSASTLLDHDTLIRILNALYDYSESEDTHSINLGAINLAKLTEQEKMIATDKGWTLI